MVTQTIQLRRGPLSNWNTLNPILQSGEMGFDTTNNKIRIGDGTSTWTALSNIADIVDGSINLSKINGNITMLKGGTGVSLVGVSGGIVYSDTSTSMAITSVGTSGQLLQSNGGVSPPSWTQGTPTGSITQFAVPTAPTGWLNCDGSTFSNVTYPALATLLGDTYGVHSGANYYLPDMRGRVPVGIGLVTDSNALTQTFTIGTKSGELKHTIAAGELPSHTHTWSGTTSSDGAHAHANPVAVTYGGDAGNYRSIFATNSPFWSMADYNNATNSAGAHTHTVSGTTAGTAATATTPVLQPYLVLNYIIKT